jgi:Family of unknown function (DUF6297)
MTGVPSVRDLRKALRRNRRAHSDRTVGELMTDVYLLAFLVVLYGGAGAYSLRRHLSQPLPAPAGTEASRSWLLVALLLAVGALAWRALRLVGPLVTTPAVQAWILSTPIDRRDWLITPLWWLSVAAGAGGAVVGALAAWAGLSPQFAVAALAGAGFGTALAALAVTAQTDSRVRRFGPADGVLIGAVVLVGASVADASARVRVPFPPIPAVVVALVGAAAAVVAVRVAARALARLDRTALAGGAQVAGAAMSAAVMLDPALLSGVVAARRWRRMGRVHSGHWLRGGALWVLFQADLRRQWRRRADLFIWAALILMPYAVAVFAPPAVGSVRIVAAYVAVDRLAGGLRMVARTPALRRALGGTDSSLKQIHLAVPAIGLAVWWAATVPAGDVPATPLVSAALIAGVLGAVYRTATRKPMMYDGGIADSPFGPIPANLIRQAVRGPDLVAVLVLIGLLASRFGPH